MMMTWNHITPGDISLGTPTIPVSMDQAQAQGHGIWEPEAIIPINTVPVHNNSDHHESMVVTTSLAHPGQACWGQEIGCYPESGTPACEDSYAPIAGTTDPHSEPTGHQYNIISCASCGHSANLAFTASSPRTTTPSYPTTPTKRYIPKVTDFSFPRFRRYKQSLEWRPTEQNDKYS